MERLRSPLTAFVVGDPQGSAKTRSQSMQRLRAMGREPTRRISYPGRNPHGSSAPWQRRQWARKEEIFRQQRRRRGGRGAFPHGQSICARFGNLPLRRQIHDGGGGGIATEVTRGLRRSRGWKLSPVGDGFWPDLDNQPPHLVEFVRPTVDGSCFFTRRRGLVLLATAAEVAVLAVVARTLAGLRR
ncbi:hypothetical protein TIFTF001_027991 [Ficus carica]|uniref:Uncharacterized protein n=1 Tax=Ficus carica TaxID=3494 RepID=A0AA88J118_FICCA|nr:hypothetical protein TIFTF001_027991 [Ficus carica]